MNPLETLVSILIVLKSFDLINISWWMVFSPMWVVVLLVLILAMIGTFMQK